MNDLRLVERMIDQDHSLFDLLREPGDVFFQSDDNQLCLFNCLSEANFAAQNFEGRCLRPLEICQGITETLAAAASSPSNSAEKQQQIRGTLEVLSIPTNYLECDETVHHGAAVYLNIDLVVATGTHINTKTPEESASYLGLDMPTSKSNGKAKLLLRCPRNREEQGVTRHYNAALSQKRRATSSSGIKRRSQNQFQVLRDEDDDDDDGIVDAECADGPHKNPRSGVSALDGISETDGRGEKVREAALGVDAEARDLDIETRDAASPCCEPPLTEAETFDLDVEVHYSGAQYSQAPNADAGASNADVDFSDAIAQYPDVEGKQRMNEPSNVTFCIDFISDCLRRSTRNPGRQKQASSERIR